MYELLKKKHRLNTPQVLFLGFLSVILLGAFLLSLPVASASGEWTNFVDALFTSTTSVCVTGLTVVPTYSYWSLFGKVVILILIQLGGLGVISIGIGLLVLVGKRITLKERMLVQETYGMDSLQGMVRLVLRIFKATIAMEAVGAIFYAIQFVPDFGFVKGIGYAVFHSISAFCNAGLDLIGETSMVPYQKNVLVSVTTMVLIVSGGIGFTVWWDLLKNIRMSRKNRVYRGMFTRLQLHSKIAIVTTAVLIFGGALLIFVLEFGNADTIGNMNLGHKVLNSFFESITTRTAGFFAIDQAGFKDTTTLILIVLMVIGGSPMGTAGGMKTTTVVMIFMSIKSSLTGRKDTEVYGRKINSDNIRSGIAVVGVFISFLFLGIVLLSITENKGLLDLTYEAASAIATVGLSRGITASLSVGGKIIIIAMMFLGRLGPITMAMAFTIRRNLTGKQLRELPDGKIIVG